MKKIALRAFIVLTYLSFSLSPQLHASDESPIYLPHSTPQGDQDHYSNDGTSAVSSSYSPQTDIPDLLPSIHLERGIYNFFYYLTAKPLESIQKTEKKIHEIVFQYGPDGMCTKNIALDNTKDPKKASLVELYNSPSNPLPQPLSPGVYYKTGVNASQKVLFYPCTKEDNNYLTSWFINLRTPVLVIDDTALSDHYNGFQILDRVFCVEAKQVPKSIYPDLTNLPRIDADTFHLHNNTIIRGVLWPIAITQLALIYGIPLKCAHWLYKKLTTKKKSDQKEEEEETKDISDDTQATS